MIVKLSANAQAALDTVVEKFQSGDLSDVVKVAGIRLAEDAPARKWTFSNLRLILFLQRSNWMMKMKKLNYQSGLEKK